jgi:hypothetical protein
MTCIGAQTGQTMVVEDDALTGSVKHCFAMVPAMENPDILKKRASALLVEVLGLLDEAGENDAALSVSEAIDRLVGAPAAFDQWLLMTSEAPASGLLH